MLDESSIEYQPSTALLNIKSNGNENDDPLYQECQEEEVTDNTREPSAQLMVSPKTEDFPSSVDNITAEGL